jgi:hypothetical protein
MAGNLSQAALQHVLCSRNAFTRAEIASALDAEAFLVVLCKQAVQHAVTVLCAAAVIAAGFSMFRICSSSALHLTHTLQLLHQTTQVLQWLEQLQQQNPGSTTVPLITRSSSSRTLMVAAAVGTAPAAAAAAAPNYKSSADWKQALDGRRMNLPGQRLFLQDLIDQLLLATGLTSPAAAAAGGISYPFPDVLTAVQVLFSTSCSNSSAPAYHTRLAVLLYYLLDGGWLSSATPFAQVGNRHAAADADDDDDDDDDGLSNIQEPIIDEGLHLNSKLPMSPCASRQRPGGPNTSSQAAVSPASRIISFVLSQAGSSSGH